MATDKVTDVDAAMSRLKPGMRIMMGEFVGAGEPARCFGALPGLTIEDVRGITEAEFSISPDFKPMPI